jgi:hypothetical protein
MIVITAPWRRCAKEMHVLEARLGTDLMRNGDMGAADPRHAMSSRAGIYTGIGG